jgi:thioredoxin reductase (NADPH)
MGDAAPRRAKAESSTAERSTRERLSAEQIARLRSNGEVRPTAAGDLLFREGDPTYEFFVILAGRVVILDGYGESAERELAEGGPGDFVAELNFFTGERLYTTAMVREAGSVLAVPRAAMVELIGTNPDLADVILPTVFARRQWLTEHRAGIRIVGSRFSPDSARLREFAARNRLASVWLDPDVDASGQSLLDDAGLSSLTDPVVFLRGADALVNPSNADFARAVGLGSVPEPSVVYDVVVVGAGPAGLAASVYGSSEGLRVATIDAVGAGGQIGTTTRFENYLGFPAGISGEEFASRSLLQARRFGTTIIIPERATGLDAREGYFSVSLEESDPVVGRSVIIAAGIEYRRLAVPEIDRYEGSSVFYSPLDAEQRIGKEEPVAVVGGGNSAGQAATALAAGGHRVTLVVRGSKLSASMVHYLVDRVEQEERIEVLAESEVVELVGDTSLRAVVVMDRSSGATRQVAASAMFILIGATPYTGWLGGAVRLDDAGYVLTGSSLGSDLQQSEPWRSMGRGPLPLETSLPGVFAAGDVRVDALKRVGSAVGDGSLATVLVHRWLGR